MNKKVIDFGSSSIDNSYVDSIVYASYKIGDSKEYLFGFEFISGDGFKEEKEEYEKAFNLLKEFKYISFFKTVKNEESPILFDEYKKKFGFYPLYIFKEIHNLNRFEFLKRVRLLSIAKGYSPIYSVEELENLHKIKSALYSNIELLSRILIYFENIDIKSLFRYVAGMKGRKQSDYLEDILFYIFHNEKRLLDKVLSAIKDNKSNQEEKFLNENLSYVIKDGVFKNYSNGKESTITSEQKLFIDLIIEKGFISNEDSKKLIENAFEKFSSKMDTFKKNLISKLRKNGVLEKNEDILVGVNKGYKLK